MKGGDPNHLRPSCYDPPSFLDPILWTFTLGTYFFLREQNQLVIKVANKQK